MRSRRASAQSTAIELTPAVQSSHAELPPLIDNAAGLGSPSAAMSAFRDQVSAQIQHLQQTVHLNLPNLPQMPALPMMPNLPDYQAYLPTAPMVRRISSLVPTMGTSRPGMPNHPAKETDSRWWDLFSGSMPPAPPAYDDIFPQSDMAIKSSSAMQAAADTLADNKCASMFDNTSGSEITTPAAATETLSSDKCLPHSREQQDQLQMTHAEKVKRLRSDRNLFFVWVCSFFYIILCHS